MRILAIVVIAGLLGVSSPALSEELNAPTTPTAASSVEGGFLIGPGDGVNISVWKDETLTRSCMVRPDGYISFPLIGEVKASDKTVLELKSEMEARLKRFVPDVILSVEVKHIMGMVVYVIGKVNNPGRLPLTANVNVLQALAAAGGLNPFAKGRKIKIFREGDDETTIFPFDYDEVVDGKHLEQNIRLRRGDVVVVP